MIPLFKVLMSNEAPARVAEVLRSGYVGEGPVCRRLEEEFSAVVGLPGVLLVNSCTSAVTLALRLCGAGPGREVVTTPVTCLATNEPILTCGATPVWADVDPETGNIDFDDALAKVTGRTCAIIAVDWGGRPCRYGDVPPGSPPVIQDAAHALGPVAPGRHGDFVCWSFQAIKFLTTADGGALWAPEPARRRARLLRWFGLDRESSADFRCSQDVSEPGYKFQSNDVAAAIGLANLAAALRAVEVHQDHAAFYQEHLAGIPGLSLPPWDDAASYWVYTVLVENRDDFVRALASRGVAASPVHRRNDEHTAFAPYRSRLPGVDEFCDLNCAIPVGWWLDDDDLWDVVRAVRLGW